MLRRGIIMEYFKYVYALNTTRPFYGLIEFDEFLKTIKGGRWETYELRKLAMDAETLFIEHCIWEGDAKLYISTLPPVDMYGEPVYFITMYMEESDCYNVASPIELEYLSEYQEYPEAY
jgi:hypothetical protein